MRFFACCFFLLLTLHRGVTQTPTVTWSTDLAAALQQAKSSNKPVLAVFSVSVWCKP
jgi:hypothetical protein